MKLEMAYLRALAKERGIPFESLASALESSILTVYKNRDDAKPTARVELDFETGVVSIRVTEFDDDGVPIAEYEDTPSDFGRSDVSAAVGMAMQRVKALKDVAVLGELSASEGDLVSGIVQQGSDKRIVFVDLGKVEAKLPPEEQVPGEVYKHGDRLRLHVVSVKPGTKFPDVVVSRTHPDLIRHLFALEVPEIGQGIVEIAAIAREAGQRTKMAVMATRSDVNPKGACIGPKSARVSAVREELRGEQIDIVDFSEDPAEFIAAALAPARVLKVTILDAPGRVARVVVPEYQVSLAIGNGGQNARLAARLTGWRIDIRPDTNPGDDEPITASVRERFGGPQRYSGPPRGGQSGYSRGGSNVDHSRDA
jgi:N utilization substance protein A